MAIQIKDNLLVGDDITHLKTPKTSGTFKSAGPDTIVIHYTAGANAESSVSTLMNPSIKASAHLVIGRDGKITQLAPFNVITWHAGKSSHLNRTSINQYSIGIEIDNAGPIKTENGKFYTWFNREVAPEDVMRGIHRNETKAGYWHRFTEVQIAIVEELCQQLIQDYGIKYIVGHEEISPGRKTDPGPAFPLDDIRNRLLQDRSDNKPIIGKRGEVTADFLNIRSDASLTSEKVANPLIKGSLIKVVDELNGWVKVETTITGWVNKTHVYVK